MVIERVITYTAVAGINPGQTITVGGYDGLVVDWIITGAGNCAPVVSVNFGPLAPGPNDYQVWAPAAQAAGHFQILLGFQSSPFGVSNVFQLPYVPPRITLMVVTVGGITHNVDVIGFYND